MNETPFRWACPTCRAPLEAVGDCLLQCARERVAYERVDNVWRLLAPEKAAYYRSFVDDYELVRRGEQWGSEGGAYYRALPYQDLSGRHPEIWRIRAISYQTMLKHVVHPLSRGRDRPLRILDLGAGNGWISYRLAQEGHQLLATDLRVDNADGLGACSWYGDEVNFETAQATFEQIPLCDDEMDLVIFGGSFHYAASYAETVCEALRVLRPDGQLVILDSPVYTQSQSGEQMVRELHGRLRRDHGINPDALYHENYLTLDRIRDLGRHLEVAWRVIKPYYGWRWALAPLRARLRRRREPARFYIFVGQR